MKITIAAGTNVGLIRQNNEDNFIVGSDLSANIWTIPHVNQSVNLGDYGALFVVADGMGGANAGEVASAVAIESIKDSFSKENLSEIIKTDSSIVEFMEKALKNADLSVYNHAKKDKSTRGMGTTAVMAWVVNNCAYISWCGDSRCYVFNPNVGLTQLSKDHSYVQELVDKGELSPENAHDHPYSNVITQCLGDSEKRVSPDSHVYSLHNGDILLLCSDGLCGLCTDEQIVDTMNSLTDDIDGMKNQLINDALNEGGYDNVTVELCKIQIEDGEQPFKDAEIVNTVRSISTGHNKIFRRLVSIIIIAAILLSVYYMFFYDFAT